MKSSFDDSTYFSQIRRLRSLAVDALKEYPIGSYELKFLRHGENATFKVITKKKNYVLRIHCRSHRTKQAFLEELKWLIKLSEKSNIPVQRPVLSKHNKLLVYLTNSNMGHHRYCDLLEWQDGHIKTKKTASTFYEVGKLLGRLQTNTMPSKHRPYWDTEGLIGKNPTLGSIDALKNDFKTQYKMLESLRRVLLKKIMTYEKSNSHKLSLIHGDMHFGNMVWNKGIVHPIDFDDCGYGLEMYDLAVTLAQSTNHFKRLSRKESSILKQALLEGYSEYKELTDSDVEIIPYLVAARELAMIGWLYGRRDNPDLWNYLKKNISTHVKRTSSSLNQAIKGTYL